MRPFRLGHGAGIVRNPPNLFVQAGLYSGKSSLAAPAVSGGPG